MTYLQNLTDQRLEPIRDTARITALQVVAEVLRGIEADLDMTGSALTEEISGYFGRARKRAEDALAEARGDMRACPLDPERCPPQPNAEFLARHLYHMHTEGDEADRRETVRRLTEGHRG